MLALVLALGAVPLAAPGAAHTPRAQAAAYGWQLSGNGGWWYATGNTWATGWQYINGAWYYFNAAGWMQTGWAYDSNAWYYLDPTTGAMQTGWQQLAWSGGTDWFYFGNDGAMLTGWQTINGQLYDLDASTGAMHWAWVQSGGAWYYLGGANDGAAHTGWQWIDWSGGSDWFYFNGDGTMCTGWLQYNGQWYFLYDNGNMAQGWLQLGDTWYYLTPGSGVMVTGQQTIDGRTSQFDDSGAWLGYAETDIMGASQTTVDQMVRWFNSKGHPYPTVLGNYGAPDIQTFCTILMQESQAEGVRAELVFAQEMLETGWLQFGGAVQVTDCNFAGIGAVDSNPTDRNTFPDVRTGIRAQVQHLKAYASTDPLVNPCVDPRFQYVKRGTTPYVEWLGIPDNPYGYGWASAAGYGYRLVDMMNELLAS
jgi:glucan-binding YG repeat protein